MCTLPSAYRIGTKVRPHEQPKDVHMEKSGGVGVRGGGRVAARRKKGSTVRVAFALGAHGSARTAGSLQLSAVTRLPSVVRRSGRCWGLTIECDRTIVMNHNYNLRMK